MQRLTPLSCLHPTFNDPQICIDDAALDSWKLGQLAIAEALLNAVIPSSKNTTHHILASRALIQTRLQQWDAATVDAERVFATLPSHT